MPQTRSGSCRNVRRKRSKRTKSWDVVESLSVKSAMGGVGFFFEETQGLGRLILSGGRVFNHL